MKYSKSILSLVTILALNSSVMADPNASYVPLTSKAYDNAWIMFGVNNFADGIASAVSDGIFTAGYNAVTEASTSDDLASPTDAVVAANLANTYFKDTGTSNMATFQALKDSTGTAYYPGTSVTMALKTSDLTFTETQPIRTMYIAVQTSVTDTNTVSKIKLDYKADLEGRTAEIQLNGAGTVYSVTISETSTFNNPGIAKYTPPVNNATPLTTPAETLTYDLAAAPIIPSLYSKVDHQGTPAGNERFYHYDAAVGVWILWDRAKVTAGSNTLLNFEKGKAYWGKMNINATTANDTSTVSTTPSGLYLAKTGLDIADSAVYTGKLTPDSWNMIAFDPASNQDIRNSTNGVVITTNAAEDNDTMVLYDETGVNSVDINFTTAATTTAGFAKFVNEKIDTAKLLGKIPQTFSIKAIGTGTNMGAGDVIFISDKKMSVVDFFGNMFAAAKTIGNQNVIDSATGAVTNITDVNLTGITSRYGEYTMLIEPLVGIGSAAELDYNVSVSPGGSGAGRSAKAQFGDIDGDSTNGTTKAVPIALANDNATSTLTIAKTNLAGDDVFTATNTAATGQVLEIDTTFDGANDMLIATSTKPFYVKDHTYTRVYSIDSTTINGTVTAPANVAYTVKNTASSTIVAPANGDAVAEFVVGINAQADSNDKTLTYAAADAANLVVVTTDAPIMDLLDADSAVKDYFTATSSSVDIAKGAIKQIIDVSRLARQDVIRNRVTVTFKTDVPASGATVDLNTTVDGVRIDPTVTTAVQPASDTDRITMLDSLVNNLNATLKTNNAAAFASHNYVDGYNDITKAVITIDGIRVSATSFDTNDTTPTVTIAEQNANNGKLNVSSAAIIADLKDNPIYTPDYVNYGPLYTLKDAGYEVKALLRASTKLAATPTTHWDAIDLTRASSDWLKNNEFNLFNVDNSAGYWAYITSYTNPNAISASNIIYTPNFVYHFNPITNATNNIIDTAAFSVEIAGADAATSNAKLVIAGSEIQLVNTATTYTANINKYEAGLVAESLNTIAIKVADGLGERYDDLNLTNVDYTKPVVPTVVFASSAQATFADTSVDTANFYLWANFIPDNGANATGPLSLTSALSYNMCTATTFDTKTSYKLVAIDGIGTFNKGNISNAKAFIFANMEKDATVLTHSNGDSASTSMRYDADCVATANTTKSGVEVRAQLVGTVKLAYQHITGSINVTNDIPVTAYYDVPTAVGTAVIQVDSVPSYANNRFYVQYNNAIYEGNFPTDRAAGDASFTSPINLTAVTAENQKLD